MFGFLKRKKKKQKEEVQKQAPKVEKEPVRAPEPQPVKEEPKAVEEPAEAEKAPEPPKEKEEPKKVRKMSYHVTKHSQGGWQIKKGGAQKALKRFSTQKEAIEYAKELEKKGASYVIHKADGTTRKKKY